MTFTDTYTYTTTRSRVIADHFQMFLVCANMDRLEVEKLMQAADNKELSAVGIYIVDAGYRIAEVSFEIDWDMHGQMIGVHGEYFDTDLPGWKDGVSPEAYIAAQNLVMAAKKLKKEVHSWIRVSPSVWKNAEVHKAVCEKLGYSFGSKVPDWKEEPITQIREVNYLPEAKVTQQRIRI